MSLVLAPSTLLAGKPVVTSPEMSLLPAQLQPPSRARECHWLGSLTPAVYSLVKGSFLTSFVCDAQPGSVGNGSQKVFSFCQKEMKFICLGKNT